MKRALLLLSMLCHIPLAKTRYLSNIKGSASGDYSEADGNSEAQFGTDSSDHLALGEVGISANGSRSSLEVVVTAQGTNSNGDITAILEAALAEGKAEAYGNSTSQTDSSAAVMVEVNDANSAVRTSAKGSGAGSEVQLGSKLIIFTGEDGLNEAMSMVYGNATGTFSQTLGDTFSETVGDIVRSGAMLINYAVGRKDVSATGYAGTFVNSQSVETGFQSAEGDNKGFDVIKMTLLTGLEMNMRTGATQPINSPPSIAVYDFEDMSREEQMEVIEVLKEQRLYLEAQLLEEEQAYLESKGKENDNNKDGEKQKDITTQTQTRDGRDQTIRIEVQEQDGGQQHQDPGAVDESDSSFQVDSEPAVTVLGTKKSVKQIRKDIKEVDKYVKGMTQIVEKQDDEIVKKEEQAKKLKAENEKKKQKALKKQEAKKVKEQKQLEGKKVNTNKASKSEKKEAKQIEKEKKKQQRLSKKEAKKLAKEAAKKAKALIKAEKAKQKKDKKKNKKKG